MSAIAPTAEEIDRATYIGGADAASIIGVSKRRTAYASYLIKTRQVKEQLTEKQRRFFARRKRLEPVVLEMLVDEYGFEVTQQNLRYTDGDFDFIKAEIDFEFIVNEAVADALSLPASFIGTEQNGEIKTVRFGKEAKDEEYRWGEDGSDHVPIDYAAQGMHGLMVRKRDLCMYGVLTGLDEVSVYGLHRNDGSIEAIRTREVQFWGFVQERTPPPGQSVEDWQSMYAAFHGTPVALDASTANKLDEIRVLKGRVNVSEEQIKKLQEGVYAYIAGQWGVPVEVLGTEEDTKDNAVLVYDGRVLATWNKRRYAWLDQTTFKEEHAALHASYMTGKPGRELRLKNLK